MVASNSQTKLFTAQLLLQRELVHYEKENEFG